ncbi:MAG TPA: nuclear transport factor 2 family protein [Saprospiraceae bacterium]|nr:nuclear transport factor 2 family protein [Saprospiraceae bacterium]
MKTHIAVSAVMIAFMACAQKEGVPDVESLEQEVIVAENAFAAMAAKDGVPAAFMHFAADDVVMHRGKRLIRGKEEMKEYFVSQPFTELKLSWKPSFASVASGGDLAYTYGPYTFSAKDSSGAMITDTGYFHTVWRRQPDGQWKFVWD